MNEVGCITFGLPGGKTFAINFDLNNNKTFFTIGKTAEELEYEFIKTAVEKKVKHLPGSDKTKRLRKKRRKAVMHAYTILMSRGIIDASRKYNVPLNLNDLVQTNP